MRPLEEIQEVIVWSPDGRNILARLTRIVEWKDTDAIAGAGVDDCGQLFELRTFVRFPFEVRWRWRNS